MRSMMLTLGFKARKKVLAVGANAKNAICFLEGDQARISPALKGLDDPKEYAVFTRTANRFLKEKPQIAACDMHPDYPSTRYVDLHRTSFGRRIDVQHHHAHIASCMAENGLGNERVIGVAFDGTGLGSDGTFWGAEILVCDYKKFKRFAHLDEVPLAGGERAIMEPWRAACFWLSSAFGERFLKLGIPFTQRVDEKKWRLVKQMFSMRVNTPLASSMGRLFDAVACVVLAKEKAHFEAELAIKLEAVAGRCAPGKTAYHFGVTQRDGRYVYDPRPLFRGIVSDIKKGVPRQEIACRFHGAAAWMVIDACCRARRRTSLKRVALSGGVFQNTILLHTCLDLLYKEGFKVLRHQKLSCSDAGISLGQAAVACFQGA